MYYYLVSRLHLMYYHLMFICKLKFSDVLSPGFPLLVLSSHLCHPLVSPTFHCKDQQNPFNESGEKSERVQLGFLGTDRHGDPGWGSWLAGVTQATQLITNSTESWHSKSKDMFQKSSKDNPTGCSGRNTGKWSFAFLVSLMPFLWKGRWRS